MKNFITSTALMFLCFQSSTATICQEVPKEGRYVIIVNDGAVEDNAVQPANILGGF